MTLPIVVMSLLACPIVPAAAADRTTCFLPLAPDADAFSETDEAGATMVLPDQAFGPDADPGWRRYMRLWQDHQRDPSDTGIRRFLGLPLEGVVGAKSVRGRAAPSWLAWRAGSYRQITTPHFTIFTRAGAEESERVALDLERCYWVWTQMFFPLWEAAPQVTSSLSDLDANQSTGEYLGRRSSRISVRRKLRVVLFRDAQEYQRTLARDIPGIERSTGFYNDEKQTIFLYASEPDDAATRRHEMVHQLFREATRSTLGRRMPAEESGFWLIEGIAGYFESLRVGERTATVGGWDSPRLQYARFRTLILGDTMLPSELQPDGRVAAQDRSDLARWYAHSIALTHRMLDGGDVEQRQWIYHQLADRYAIRREMPSGQTAPDETQSMTNFLRLTDADLIANPGRGGLKELCLATCELTEDGLASLPAQAALQWFDVSRLPIGADTIRRLAPRPELIQRLSLEATRIDTGMNDWIGRATNVREIDLSWTKADDSTIRSLAAARQIEVLWLTGSGVSDAALDTIVRMPRLESVDLQRTKVTAAGLQRFRAARPGVSVNPLELRTQ